MEAMSHFNCVEQFLPHDALYCKAQYEKEMERQTDDMQSAVLRLHVVCLPVFPSVCLSLTLVD